MQYINYGLANALGAGQINPNNGAVFDGSTYLSRGADLTSNADGKKGILAMQLRLNGGDGTSMYLLGNPPTALFKFYRESNNKFRLQGYNAAVTLLMYAQSTTTYTTASGLINILAAWDLSTTTVQFYAAPNKGDPVDDYTVGSAPVNDSIDYTGTDFFVGADPGPSKYFDGDLKFVYANFAETIDISVLANRRKFFDANGQPVIDPNGDGSEATGTAPILYLASTYDQFENNKGSGGGLTVNGGTLSQSV